MLNRNIKDYIGQPIGVELKNGFSFSGILCNVKEEKIIVLEYLFQDRFIKREYDSKMIQGIYLFPTCENNNLLN